MGVYRLILGCLFVAILATGVLISIQTQKRHANYRTLQLLKKELAVLKVEEQRLLIEQQTFSATPQVAKRAVDELGMFLPTKKHRVVVSPAKSVQGDNHE